MRKWLRYGLIVCGGLLALIIIAWLGLAWYISANKKTILVQINTRLSERLNGQLVIGDMSPSLVRSFPNVSVGLKNVTLQDSLWAKHHHTLLDASLIFVKINTAALLKKQLDIQEITFDKGAIYLFTDSLGYSNTSVFRRGRKKEGKNNTDAAISRLQMRDVQFTLENHQKHKLFKLNIQYLKGTVQSSDTARLIDLTTAIHISNFEFNTDKGSYIKDKLLEATNMRLVFNRKEKILRIPAQDIRIDKQPVNLNGSFDFGPKPPAFALDITVNNVAFRKAASFMPPNISGKLKHLDLEKPLDIKAVLRGHMQYRDTPLVRVSWKTTNNTFITKAGTFNECSFTGGFFNELVPGNGHNDENSIVHLNKLSAKWLGVPLQADTVRVLNLKHPALSGHFRSKFPLTDLNEAAGGDVFQFNSGTAVADLYYKGGVTEGDTIQPFLRGIIQVEKGAMVYLPRNLSFKDCNATLAFTGNDLVLQNIRIRTDKSALMMEGTVRNLMNFYFSAPDKILLDWKIKSPVVDLNEFRSFLAQRGKAKSTATTRKKVSRAVTQLDIVLNQSNVNMQVQLDKVLYRRFNAQQVKADLTLTQTGILLRQIALQHAGGSLNMKGNIQQDGNNNKFKVNASLNNVHIDQLFYAFNNFGLEKLTSNNLKGILSANIDLSGNVLDNGTLVKHSLFGSLGFNLRQAALIHFEPLENIGKFVFRRRNMSNITFDNLRNTLEVKGNKVIIPPMRIATSAINMDVAGVYGLGTGTNISLDIPLRNPAKDSAITDEAEKLRRSRKGLIVHLHAVNDKDGKVKLKLGKADNDD
ncbi:AsmA-like C-terminal region-containing protein [Chitinophaga sp. MD30]|uniref:AsmA family protein n=1 Tax=Chitinophaga sp. MD30 TaxID=2033437 RepID=UPI000BAFEB52|nr:AsmA-like C-terminal region-containing protein [Chitinophaga sp. MD30]ASZ12869.1 hypothetical protein CK934_18865 [Chitinophaga sp. MD30]